MTKYLLCEFKLFKNLECIYDLDILDDTLFDERPELIFAGVEEINPETFEVFYRTRDRKFKSKIFLI